MNTQAVRRGAREISSAENVGRRSPNHNATLWANASSGYDDSRVHRLRFSGCSGFGNPSEPLTAQCLRFSKPTAAAPARLRPNHQAWWNYPTFLTDKGK